MSDQEKGAGKAARVEEQAPDGRINRLVLNLGRQDLLSHDTASFQVSRLKPCLERLKKERFVERLWSKDAGLWKEDGAEQESIRNALGWLDVVERMREKLPDLVKFAGRSPRRVSLTWSTWGWAGAASRRSCSAICLSRLRADSS